MSIKVDAPEFWQLQALHREAFKRGEQHVTLYDSKEGGTYLVKPYGNIWKVTNRPLREIDLRTIYGDMNFVDVQFRGGVAGYDGVFRLIIYPLDKLDTQSSYNRAKEISSSWK